jgi:hypothetical protein
VIQSLKVKSLKIFIRIVDKSLKLLNSLSQLINGPTVLYEVHSFYNETKNNNAQNVKSVNSDIAILMQGPIDQNILATIQTVKMYQSYWPEVPVVISTWVSSKRENIESLNELGAFVELSEEPKIPGISNANYQISSTIAGLERISTLGISTALKTRVDQTLFNSRSLVLLDRMLKEFGDRIVTTDFNSFLFRLYSPNDQFMFAKTEKLMEFWNAANTDWRKLQSITGPVESKFLISFLQAKGMPVRQDLRSSLEIYRDIYAFMNYEDLDLVWNKGSFRNLRSRFPQEFYPSSSSFVRHQDWLNLQQSMDSYIEDAGRIER